MTLGEIRKRIGEENFDKVPACNKIYIDVDYNEISVGLPKDFLDGMRAVANSFREPKNTYLTFAQLLKNESIHTLSDGHYDMPIAKGTPVPLECDLDKWEVYLSEKIEGCVDVMLDDVA